jgi:hypothetical protein
MVLCQILYNHILSSLVVTELGNIMRKEQVEHTVELLREGHALTAVAKLAGINVMYVSVIRKLMVMELLKVDAS